MHISTRGNLTSNYINDVCMGSKTEFNPSHYFSLLSLPHPLSYVF